MKIVTLQNFPAVDELIERFGARHLPFVLDSSLSNDGLGTWSFFGADPFLVFEGKDGSYVERRRRSAGDGEAMPVSLFATVVKALLRRIRGVCRRRCRYCYSLALMSERVLM